MSTWPLVISLRTAIPLGTEQEGTAPLFSLWCLWWNANRIGHAFSGYWDAPIFHPVTGSFAFSELLALPGLLTAPLWLVGTPPALIYNIALLTVLALNGVFAYRLLRALGVDEWPALVGATLAVTLPYLAKMAGVLQVISLFGVSWALDGLIRFGRDGSWRHAASAGAGLIAQILAAQQLALLFLPLAVAGATVALAQQRYEPRAIVRLVTSGLGVAGLVAVTFHPVMVIHREMGFRRAEWVVQALSARPRDFLTRPMGAVVQVPPSETAARSDTEGLFPGAVLIVLAAASTGLGLWCPLHRTWTLYFLGGAVWSAGMALGLNLSLAGWHPFATLRDVVPGLAQLRAPYRSAALAQQYLVPLAGLALQRVFRHPGNCALVSGSRRLSFVIGLGLLAVAETLVVPARLLDVPLTPRTGWTAWLASRPSDVVIAHVPFPAGLHAADYEVETWRMFHQIDHRRRMINGFSSYFPPGYTAFQLEMRHRFPNRSLLCHLSRGFGVGRLVIDQVWLSEHGARIEPYARVLRLEYADHRVAIYQLAMTAADCTAP